MATTFEKLLLAGTSAAYKAIATPDPTKLYFLTDTKQLYKGSDLFTDSIRKVTARPETPAINVLYDVTTTKTIEYFDGTDWVVIRPEMVTTIAVSSTDAQFPTAKAVYDYVQEQIESLASSTSTVKNVESGTTDATLKITKGDDSTQNVTVKGVVTTPSYDSTTRKITLPVSGQEQPLVIELGKDIFVDSTKDNKYNPETGNIELFLNDGSKIEIPASSLVDTYTGGSTTTATVTVGTDDNVIKVNVKLSTAEGNAITVDAENGGLFLSLADYATKTYVDEQVGGVDEDVQTLLTDMSAAKTAIQTLNGDENTAGSVKKAVKDLSDTVNTTTTQIQEDVSTNTDNITSLTARVKALEDAFGWGTF